VQIVPEVVSAVGPTVPVEHSEVGYFLPLGAVLRLGDVQNDSHTIFIVVSDGALVCGRGISLDIAIGLDAVLGRLEVGDGQEHFRQGRIRVLDNTDVPYPKILSLGVKVDLLPDNLVRLSNRRLRLRPWLVLIRIALLSCPLHLHKNTHTSTRLLDEEV
jgi:hypothetical protein